MTSIPTHFIKLLIVYNIMCLVWFNLFWFGFVTRLAALNSFSKSFQCVPFLQWVCFVAVVFVAIVYELILVEWTRGNASAPPLPRLHCRVRRSDGASSRCRCPCLLPHSRNCRLRTRRNSRCHRRSSLLTCRPLPPPPPSPSPPPPLDAHAWTWCRAWLPAAARCRGLSRCSALRRARRCARSRVPAAADRWATGDSTRSSESYGSSRASRVLVS